MTLDEFCSVEVGKRDWFGFLAQEFHCEDIVAYHFSFAVALYLFASLYHGGQWSPEYQLFGYLDKQEFKAGPCLSARELKEDILARETVRWLYSNRKELFA